MLADIYRYCRHVYIAIKGIESIVFARLLSAFIGNIGKEPFVAITGTTGDDMRVGEIHVIQARGICQRGVNEIGVPRGIGHSGGGDEIVTCTQGK